MNGAHAHLLLNHFPILGSFFSTILLLGGILSKSDNVKKAGLLFFVFTAILTAPTFLTGHEAVETLKAIGQAPHAIIMEHEKVAEAGLWTCMIVGLLSMFGYFSIQKKYGEKLIYVVLVTGFLNCAFMFYIGNTGGQIRHTEIREIGSFGGE